MSSAGVNTGVGGGGGGMDVAGGDDGVVGGVGIDPMDVDPVDDGPRPESSPSPHHHQSSPFTFGGGGNIDGSGHSNSGGNSNNNNSNASSAVVVSMTKEEEAKQTIDMLRGEDVASRIAAASRLDVVAATLGEVRTRDELLPYVTDGVDDEDEVLLALASSLGKMVDRVGGPEYAHVLLRPLEMLLTVEETTVRQAASESAKIVGDALPETTFNDEYASMIARLANKEWFTARISAAALLSTAYGRITEEPLREDFVHYYGKLCRDDTPMVRRVAAQYLGAMVENVVRVLGRDVALSSDGIVSQTLLPLYEEFASNDQPDSVRLQTPENCVAFGRVVTNVIQQEHKQKEEQGASIADDEGDGGDGGGGTTASLRESESDLLRRILPLIVATIDDRSWRVRWTAAAKFADVIASYDSLPSDANAMDSLVPAYEKLLQDPEAEVRTAATLNLAHVAKCKAKVPPSGAGGQQPPPQQQQQQSQNNGPAGGNGGGNKQPQQDGSGDGNNGGGGGSMDTSGGNGGGGGGTTGPRVSVAERLVKRVTSLTEDDSEHVRASLALVATELAPILGKDATITYLVPPVLLLLRDAASEVRLNLISSLSSLNEVIGVDLLSQSLLPAILDLARDGKWRIRHAIIQHIPLLAKQLGKEFFTEKLSSLCVGWLGDDIACIRASAASNLKELTALFGSDWAVDFLIPSIAEIRQHESYLRRLTALQAFAMMATAMSPENVRLHILPIVLDMSNDIVPNIRFNVAKQIETIAPVCGMSAYESQLMPVLNMLLDDDDRDVRYFAEKTMNKLEDQFAGTHSVVASH